MKYFKLLFIFICIFLITGCKNSKGNDKSSSAIETAVADYSHRLRNEDLSLLKDLNSISDKDVVITGWKGVLDGANGFYVQLENQTDRIIVIHRPEHNIVSNIYKVNDKDWVDINVSIYPQTVPNLIIPDNPLLFFFPLRKDLISNVNLRVSFSIPQYTHFEDQAFRYSERHTIKVFEVAE